MITTVPSVYPIWLEPIPSAGIPGKWQNLGNFESLTFDSDKCQYILRSTSGINLPIPEKWAYQIVRELKQLVKERREGTTKPKTK